LREVDKMKMRIGYMMLVILIVVSFSDVSAFGLRCGVDLVSIGDTTSEVIAKCGEPSKVESWEVPRRSRYYRHSLSYLNNRKYRESLYSKGHTTIEKWTYNFGFHRFIRYLTFKNSKLKRITKGGYGY
jgi:hypothetical protein